MMLRVCHLLGVVKSGGAAEASAERILLLAIILAGGALSTQEQYKSQFSYDGCTIPCYISLAGFPGGSAEYNFLFQVLLSRIHTSCRCQIQFMERDNFGKTENGAQLSTGRSILAISSDAILKDEEVQYLVDGRNGQNTVLLLHLGDETLLHTEEFLYSGAVLTMRNYYNKHMNESSLEYLRSKQVRSAMPKIVWLPLGTTKLVPLPRAAVHELFQDRPLLWSWAGSVNGRPERDDMVKALKESSNADELLALGKLVEASDFAGYDCGGDASLSKWEYSALLHNTKFMPLPSGVNPEQYRIWEAIEAGCIPIILTRRVANDGALYPLRYLGFEYLELDEWGALPDLLWQLYNNVNITSNVHRYQSMSEHNSRLWLHIKNRIAGEIADVACSEV